MGKITSPETREYKYLSIDCILFFSFNFVQQFSRSFIPLQFQKYLLQIPRNVLHLQPQIVQQIELSLEFKRFCMFSSDIQQMSSCVQTKLCCCTVLSVAPKCQFQSSRQHSEGEGVIFQILQCSVRAGCLMLLIFLVFCAVCFLVVFVFCLSAFCALFPMFPVSLDYPFPIAPSGFSHV